MKLFHSVQDIRCLGKNTKALQRKEAVVKSKRTDMDEIARKLGVSRATVSTALSGRGRVSEATRAMVIQCMNELNYVPNLHAQQLATGRSWMVALHVSGFDFGIHRWSIEITRGVQNALQSQGYRMVLDATSDLTRVDSLLVQSINSHALDGVILVHGDPYDSKVVQQLASPRTPFVLIGANPIVAPNVASIMYSGETGIRQLVGKMTELGHRRIGYIGWRPDSVVLSRFRECLEESGLTLPEELIALTACQADTPDQGASAMRQLLSLPSPPSAVLARVESLALGAMKEATRHGLKVPDDISIVAHDDVYLAQFTDPPLTTVRVDVFKLGRWVADTLFHLLKNPDESVSVQTIDCGSLTMRQSLGPYKPFTVSRPPLS
ncbi:MAG: LacI family DNA-binding transcriptional regulator [Armatimonadota bacterium]